MKPRALRAAVALHMAIGAAVRADPPSVGAVFPAGAAAGSETSVTAIGNVEPWPAQAWCSDPGVSLEADPEMPKTFRVKIADDATRGPCTVRIFNDEGVSAPRTFVVGPPDRRDVVEDEEGHPALDDPQPVDGALPLVIHGRLAKRDEVDFYRVALPAGVNLRASLDAYMLGSPIDPLLRLFRADGTPLAFAHDSAATIDPDLRFEVPEAGNYVIAVMAFAHPPSVDIGFHGDESAVYRLEVRNEEPPLTEPMACGPPAPMALPCTVEGWIASPSGEMLEFRASKDDKFVFVLKGQAIGSPIDGVLAVRGVGAEEDAKVLAQEDDTGKSPDPQIAWTAPEDGAFAVTIRDRFGRFGPEMRYRLDISEPVPEIAASVESHSFVAGPDAPAEIEVSIRRGNGHNLPAAIHVAGLPQGIRAEADEVPPDKDKAGVRIVADPGAPAFSGPIRITLRSGEGDAADEIAAVYRIVPEDDRGPLLIKETPDFWLTVIGSAETSKD